MRVLHLVSYLGFIVVEVIKGSLHLARFSITPGRASQPAIVEYPLRCRSDIEVAIFTSSITITPGTLVVALAGSGNGDPATIYVHSLFGGGRTAVIDGLRDMEDRLLRATRGRQR